MCAHLIFVAVVKKCYTLRPQAWQIPVGQNRKRGRPRKATRALIRDIEENLNEADVDEDDDDEGEQEDGDLYEDEEEIEADDEEEIEADDD